MVNPVEWVNVVLNPDDNSGEWVQIDAEIHDNGDRTDNMFAMGHVSLQCYGNMASISLGEVTPQMFREFADKLEAALAKHARSSAPPPPPDTDNVKGGIPKGM